MRKTRLLSLCSGCAVVSVLAAAAPGDAATTTVTNGQAQAVLARIVPYVGLPGVAASIGSTAAEVEGDTARASATAADFGLLGTLAGAAASDLPALPSPITADSEGTTKVDREPVPLDGTDGTAKPDAAKAAFSAAHEQAVATKAPTARGTVTGPVLGVPGLIEIIGGRSQATSDAKQSLSEVTISSVDLGAGAVVLSGLRWTAQQVGTAVGTATFSLGGLSVAGQATSVDGAESLATAIAAANTALEPVGLALAVPSTTADANGGVVAPLIIQVRNPEALVAPSAQASEALKPVLAEMVTSVIAAYPNAGAAQIVLNAALGAAGGRSGGRLELGGVSARLTRLAVADDTASVNPIDALGTATVGTGTNAPGQAGADGATGTSSVVDSPAGGADSPGGATYEGAAPGAAPDRAVPFDTSPATAAVVVNDFGAAAPAVTGMNPRTVAYKVPESQNRTAPIALGLGLLVVVGLAVGDRLRIRALSR